jgi:hypothetical protein
VSIFIKASQNFRYDFLYNQKAKKLKKNISAHSESTDLVFEAYKRYPSRDTLPLRKEFYGNS